MARRNRCVSGEDGGGLYLLRSIFEAHAILHLLPYPLQYGESRVTLVEVKDRVLNAQGFQDLGSANAQDNLLDQSFFRLFCVKAGGHSTVPWIIPFDICIYEVKGYPAHLGLPNLEADRVFRDWNLYHQGLAIFIQDATDGSQLPVEHLTLARLPSIGRELLVEIALRIHESQSDHGNSQVAALLEKITGQKAQASGIKGQRVMQAVLC